MRYEQPKAETFPVVLDGATTKGLARTLHGDRRNQLARIGNRQLKPARDTLRSHPHGLILRAVECIAEEDSTKVERSGPGRNSPAAFAVPGVQDHINDEQCHNHQADESEPVLPIPSRCDTVRGQGNKDQAAAYGAVVKDRHPGEYATASAGDRLVASKPAISQRKQSGRSVASTGMCA